MNLHGEARVLASRVFHFPRTARGDARPTKFVLPLLAALVLFFAAGATAETTNDSVEAIIQGRKLAWQILEQRPAGAFTQAGILQVRDANGRHSTVSIKCEVLVTPTNWQNSYKAFFTNATETLLVIHSGNQTHEAEGDFPKGRYIFGLKNDWLGSPNTYIHDYPSDGRLNAGTKDASLAPFAGSDFLVADLSLEFFHWPQQKILKKEFRRNCSCAVLESTNPNPSPNAYSRVLSWIDEDSGGIVMAEAYDAQGKLLKEFYPKDVKKVNGQWQVQTMEMDNVQTGSRTRLEFDLKN